MEIQKDIRQLGNNLAIWKDNSRLKENLKEIVIPRTNKRNTQLWM